MDVGRPRARANLSPVWRHFSRIGDRRSCLGSCLHCGTEVAVPGGSTTGMFSHLAVHHPDHYREAKEPHLLPSPPLPPQSPFSNLSQASRTPPSLVSVKSLAPADNIFPHLGVTFSVRPLPQPAPTPPDLVIHCSDGLVGTHRLLLAAVSPLARLVLGGDLEDHLVLPGVKVAQVRELMEGLCSGRLEKSPDLLPLLNMLCILGEAEECEDMDGEGDESYLEPVLHMNIGEAMPGEGGGHHPLLQDHQDGCFSSDYDNLASDAEIEAKALELKEKIFAECGMVSRRKKAMRNTRNPSKIWRWFTKTPDYIYCKVCGLGIKNSGNTTNASSHLKRHPRQYAEFKMEVIQQPLLLEESIREEEEGEEKVSQYFHTSKKFNRKSICNLCGKETPSGNSNLLLHLRHHHPQEHRMLVPMVKVEADVKTELDVDVKIEPKDDVDDNVSESSSQPC